MQMNLDNLSEAMALAMNGRKEEAWDLLFEKPSKSSSSMELINTGFRGTFEQSREHYKEKGMRMAGMSDYYKFAKQCMQTSDMMTLETLRKDMGCWLWSSLLEYNNGMVSVDRREPVKSPEFWDVPLANVLEDKDGLRLFQELCQTMDDAQTILSVFCFLSGKEAETIKVWIPESHGKKFTGAASLYYSLGLFHIIGSSIISNGRSCGVSEAH